MRSPFRWLRAVLASVAVLALVWAAAVFLTGGVAFDAGRIRIRSHDPIRPVVVALVCLAGYGLLAGLKDAGRQIRALLVALRRRAPLGGVGLSLAVLVLALGRGTFVAGGSDAYGYVSQAELWEQGRLHVPQPLAPVVAWPDALATLAPLGYMPAADGETIVPTYAPGLPLLMALFRTGLGPCAQYYVAPLLGALAVWLTFVFGRRVTGSGAVGLSAALVLATSPPFLAALLWPMSDVPAAACWTLALVLALPGTVPAGLAAGAAAGVAILIRPNLAPLAGVIAAALTWPAVVTRLRPPREMGPPLAFVCGLAPAVLFVAGLNTYLYGSPLRSGYGTFAELYEPANAWVNLRAYLGWMVETGSVCVLVGMAAVLSPWPRLVRPAATRLPFRAMLGSFIVVVWLSYLVYARFENASYLRFLLPVWPLSIVAAVALVRELLLRVRLRAPLASALVLVLALVVAQAGYRLAAERGVFRQREVEARHVDAAALVARNTGPETLVLAMQHSGSIRYYAGRQTVRYDLIDPAWLDRVVAAASAGGIRVLAVLEDWEEPLFRKRFEPASPLGRLEWLPVAELRSAVRVWVFDLTDPGAGRFAPAPREQADRCTGAAVPGVKFPTFPDLTPPTRAGGGGPGT